MTQRIFLFLSITCLVFLSGAQAFPQDFFQQEQPGLTRVWLNEISAMTNTADFESGNYRLDTDFRLGYGDTLKINLEGRLTAQHEVSVDRDGNVVIPALGKIGVMGLTMEEAQKAIAKELNKQYVNVDLTVTLADVRNIRISVMGNVKKPGSYAVSPFVRVMDALTMSGGPNDHGSLIKIKVIREGEEPVVFNVYDFFRYNDQSKNIRLKHGDIVQVCEAEGFFGIKGDVRYPGIYEMTEGARLHDLIELADGMIPTKFERQIILLRMNTETQQRQVVEKFNFDSSKPFSESQNIKLEYNDTVIVTTAFNYNPTPVELYKTILLEGELVIPGKYWAEKNDTLGLLLKKSAGVKSTAFLEGAVFTRREIKQRQKTLMEQRVKEEEEALLKAEAALAEMILPSQEREMKQQALQKRREALDILMRQEPQGRMIIDLKAVLAGTEDVLLRDGDRLFVPQIPDSVLVTGAVYNSQAVFYREGKGLDYYLNAVGGPNKTADREDVYVIKPDGRVESAATGYGKISRGDIIVVPEKME